jgi:hypothetical protein
MPSFSSFVAPKTFQGSDKKILPDAPCMTSTLVDSSCFLDDAIEGLIAHFLSFRPERYFEDAREWTVLAGMFVHVGRGDFIECADDESSSWKLVCAASGTNCLNPSQLSTIEERFFKVHDAHAEVLVRRSFLLSVLLFWTNFHLKK